MPKKENTPPDTGKDEITRANRQADRELLIAIAVVLAGVPLGLLIFWLM